MTKKLMYQHIINMLIQLCNVYLT